MDIQKIINSIDFDLSKEENKEIEKKSKQLLKELGIQIRKFKIKAEPFVGGSFAKGTLMKKEKYDVDVFVRFDLKKEVDENLLSKALVQTAKKLNLKFKVIHGSRDYFALQDNNLIFEIVPVRKILKPEQAVNSTDLSYFHVKYIKNAIKNKPKIRKEIIAAKAFCRAQKVYGAESWIHGFSGYSLECLVIAYGSFLKMLKELSIAKEQVVLDPNKLFKRKNEILIELNESKRKGPVVLVDPTYKFRNVTAALNQETFEKFQEAAKKFLKNPSTSFFFPKKINENELNKEEGFVKIEIKTEKQEGDIAGAKLEKFYRFIIQEISKNYQIKENFFEFNEKQQAEIYLMVKPNKEITLRGPPLNMEEHAKAFKEEHPEAYSEKGVLYVKMNVEPIKIFLEKWKEKKSSQIKEMDISEIKVN